MLKSKTAPYTDKNLEKIAKRFNTRNDFQKGARSAYKVAIKRGPDFLDCICLHMISSKTEKYSYEELETIAKKYVSRSEFARKDSGAHTAAIRKEKSFYEKICEHMEKPKISYPEKTILEAVLVHFPNAKKFRATNLSISGKEYIKSLEVDILVNSVGKAIEYDSDRFHNLEGLKRGHPTWSDDDIKNYHEIKDAAFLSLGIQILHIKEKDWKKDSELCIKKCLEFLKS